ncbi:hypothetical protein C5167_022507 [Papaver somniferum]|uniref:Integrase zinc-binding domain-containing protein n=1 Tax=Papaver somniferum TaxID=3469 RepID=A0A4Y7JL30_PAPSO|nr:hypothetical protein C5167_022507 [Papaver somniferum]
MFLHMYHGFSLMVVVVLDLKMVLRGGGKGNGGGGEGGVHVVWRGILKGYFGKIMKHVYNQCHVCTGAESANRTMDGKTNNGRKH